MTYLRKYWIAVVLGVVLIAGGIWYSGNPVNLWFSHANEPPRVTVSP